MTIVSVHTSCFLLLVDRMPAYNASFVFAIFFIVYILINTYIFMSVFLAVVYNNYKKYLKVRVSAKHVFPDTQEEVLCFQVRGQRSRSLLQHMTQEFRRKMANICKSSVWFFLKQN